MNLAHPPAGTVGVAPNKRQKEDEPTVVLMDKRQSTGLTRDEIAFFNENGYLRLRAVYSPDEVQQLSDELDRVMEAFVTPGKGWRGSWRKDSQYLSAEEEEKAVLAVLHGVEQYSEAWAYAVLNRRLVAAIADLIGPEVEFHHTTLHAKGPEFGTPFPMHQDYPFYEHADGRYIDALLHVSATTEENGCLKFLPGSHKSGPLEHIKGDGEPHLPPDKYRIEDAVSCPADAGGVVLFSINTVHGSALNRTSGWRRLMRMGYRNPGNRQLGGHANGRPGWMVRGVRPKVEGINMSVQGLGNKVQG
jgi:phytanoyl-CoA hydroxylase